MTRDFTPGAWYGELLPSGEWCAVVPGDGTYTHLGRIGLPPGEPFGPRFVRCTNIDWFRFGGQADTIEPAAWEWSSNGWRSYPQPCIGTNPVIYDRHGAFIRSDGSAGSQGFRYVTPQNVIVSGDATYHIDLGHGQALSEYTDVGGLLIGQGAYDGGGVQVWDGTTLRQLKPGYCVFVRANRAGETVTIAFFDGELNGVVRLVTTMAELRALPPVVTPPEPPKHPDPPVPPKPPEPPIPPPLVRPVGDIMLTDPSKTLIYAKAINPHPSRKGASTITLTNGRVFSCQPDGSAQDRDPGTDGGYETCQISGTLATFQPVGTDYFTFGIALVDKL